jgi:arsenate reductase
MLKEFGHQTLINRRGTTWRKIPQIEREAITDETAANLIVNFPSLIKRPVIKRKTTWLVGYDEFAFERICPPIHDI